MSISLYQLTADYQSALDSITVDESTGEVFGMEVLDGIEAQYDAKAINCALYIKSLNAEAAAIKEEEAALKKRREAMEKKSARIKRYVEDCMNAAGKAKISDARVQLSFRTSKQVYIDDESKLPEKFIIVKTERKPDKTAIRQEISAGKTVAGARLLVNHNLQIK